MHCLFIPVTESRAINNSNHNSSSLELLDQYRQMLLIRLVEERLTVLFADGEVPGFIHLGIGQEAVAVGVISQLEPDDTVASNHRGHGHALAKGLSITSFFYELLGMEQGLCKGRGGSMHVADFELGLLGANGIVGAGMSIAVGSALAHKTLKRNAVAVAFFGDGALAEGLFHESINMAKLLELPILFVCENNGWSEFSPTDAQIAFQLDELTAGYGISYSKAFGNDVSEVAQTAKLAVDQIRETSVPALLECKTLRVRGHFEGDAQKYRESDCQEVEAHDPIRITSEKLLETGVQQSTLDDIRTQINKSIEAAVVAARRGTLPDFQSALAGVYAASEQM
jgi:pyruvate dehydrogenase E1 component alpha subunit